MKIKTEHQAVGITKNKEYKVLHHNYSSASIANDENHLITIDLLDGYWKTVECIDFDIEAHEFSNGSDIGASISSTGNLKLVYGRRTSANVIYLNKKDAIAIAKALGVTGDDL